MCVSPAQWNVGWWTVFSEWLAGNHHFKLVLSLPTQTWLHFQTESQPQQTLSGWFCFSWYSPTKSLRWKQPSLLQGFCSQYYIIDFLFIVFTLWIRMSDAPHSKVAATEEIKLLSQLNSFMTHSNLVTEIYQAHSAVCSLERTLDTVFVRLVYPIPTRYL